MKERKAMCYNCKHAGEGFKVAKMTHHYCEHKKHENAINDGTMHPLDTLMIFANTCDDHEFKD